MDIYLIFFTDYDMKQTPTSVLLIVRRGSPMKRAGYPSTVRGGSLCSVGSGVPLCEHCTYHRQRENPALFLSITHNLYVESNTV